MDGMKKIYYTCKKFLAAMFILYSLTYVAGCKTTRTIEEKEVAMALNKEERISHAKNRWFEHYAKRLELFIDELPIVKTGGVIFLGDSITEGFPTKEAFPNENVINRGIGGDLIEGVIDRLDISIAPLKPKKIYLMIGINNLVGYPDKPIDEFAMNYNKLLDELKQNAPDAKIIAQSILPTSKGFAHKNSAVRIMNEKIKLMAEQKGLEYVDLHPAMADVKGELKSEYTGDGIHLNIEGYQAWLKEIVPADKYFDVLVNLSPMWNNYRGSSRAVDAIDPIEKSIYPGARGPEQLIIYTPKYGKPSTGTNEWGNEAVVQNGVVTKIGGNNSPIPPDGFVVSGHNTAGNWILANLKLGYEVIYDQNEVQFKQPKDSSSKAPVSKREMRIEFLNLLAMMSHRKAPQTLFEKAKNLYFELEELDAEAHSSQFFKWHERLKELEIKVQEATAKNEM